MKENKTKLSEVCAINPKTDGISDDIDVSFIGMSDVSENGDIKTDTCRQYGEVKKGFTSFKEGDVLFAKITPCMENGKGALATNLKNGLGCGSTEFHVLRPKPEYLNGKWLYYLTAWPFFRNDAEKHMTGSAGQKRVPKAFLEKYEQFIPSLDVQNEQVLRLDLLKHIIDQRNKELTALEQLIKARFVEMFVDNGYPLKKVHDVLETAFWLMPATPEFILDGDVPYITSKNIKNRKINFENVKYISKESYYSISSNRPTHMGDILVSMIGTLGQTAVITDDRLFYGQNLYLLRLDGTVIDTDYFCEFFNSDSTQHELQGQRNQSTQAYLKANHVEGLTIPVPPITKQKDFAKLVQQVDKSKAAVQKALDEAQVLFDSLMQEYFG